MDQPCVSCKKYTTTDEKVMACDVYDNREHISCLCHCDILSQELYEALKECCGRTLLYVCTRYRARGSIVKHFHEHEIESTCVQEQWLTCTQRLDKLSECIRELCNEKHSMLERQVALKKEV